MDLTIKHKKYKLYVTALDTSRCYMSDWYSNYNKKIENMLQLSTNTKNEQINNTILSEGDIQEICSI
jgi:hypothetical protein